MTALPKTGPTVQDLIDRWHEEHSEKPRPHMGASLLGHPCERWLWLSFRWAVREPFPGRLLRLFRRGQREEQTIVQDLRAIGINIHSTCLDGDGQHRVDLGKFVGGSIDGIIESGVPGAEKTRHIAEFKTHNLRSFTELKKLGVFEAKRRHWCQMQVYMAGTHIDRALYVAVCKDNDEMYTERVPFNAQAAADIIARGQRLALAERLPAPLSSNPAWYQCKTCAAHDFCHVSHCIKADAVSCRTCAHATPCENGTWTCHIRGNAVIDGTDAQLSGCAAHVLHPDLVPWTFKSGNAEGTGAIYTIDGVDYLNGYGAGALTSVQLLSGERTPEPNQAAVPF